MEQNEKYIFYFVGTNKENYISSVIFVGYKINFYQLENTVNNNISC